jgi:hypothetical protein
LYAWTGGYDGDLKRRKICIGCCGAVAGASVSVRVEDGSAETIRLSK